MAEIVADKKFQDWVTASKVRQKLFQQADKMYDYETADELFNLWKDRVQAVQQTANSEKQERKQAVKNASVGTTQGSTTPSSRKIYRRSDKQKENYHGYTTRIRIVHIRGVWNSR